MPTPTIHIYGDAIVTPDGEVITLPPTVRRAAIINEVYECWPEAGRVHHQEVASYFDIPGDAS